MSVAVRKLAAYTLAPVASTRFLGGSGVLGVKRNNSEDIQRSYMFWRVVSPYICPSRRLAAPLRGVLAIGALPTVAVSLARP